MGWVYLGGKIGVLLGHGHLHVSGLSPNPTFIYYSTPLTECLELQHYEFSANVDTKRDEVAEAIEKEFKEKVTEAFVYRQTFSTITIN